MDNYYNNSNSYDDDDDPLYVLDDMDDDAGHVFSQLSAYAGPANSDLFFEFQNILMKKKEIQKKFYIKIEKKISEAWLYIGMELVILKEFATFLKIFKECTTTLQGCKYSTSNLYLLFLIHIKKK